MLLNRLVSRARRAQHDERGSALVAVIGVSAVTMVVSALVLSSVVGAMGYTTATRAGVQSQASAEAGIAVAQASLLRGECTTGIYTSTVEPKYDVTVSYTIGGVTTVGCPPEGVSSVTISAAGEARDLGITQSSGDEREVEVVYVAPANGVAASGAAIYAYSATGFGGSGSLVSSDGSDATVHIKTGNVQCDGTSNVPDGFVVENGSIELTGSCNISGTVWASGLVKVTGSTRIGGDVWASALELTGSSKVIGDAYLTGNAKFAWSTSVGGHLTAKSLTSPNPPGNTPGGSTIIPSGPQPYAIPRVADWIDFASAPADWPGFDYRTISGNCTFGVIQTAVNQMTGPGVLDARSCTGDFGISSYQTLAVPHDLVIMSDRFSFGGSPSVTSSGAEKLWFVTPDLVENGVPDCPAGGKFKVDGTLNIAPSIGAFIYSPCRVEIGSSITWRGQVFAGRVSVAGAAKIDFKPVGLPGYDVSTGTPIGGSTALADLLLNPTVVRNTSGG